MIHIATPVSNFFFNKSYVEKIIQYSDVLEAREKTYHLDLKNIRLMHFDVDLVIIWSNLLKDKILQIVNALPNLDLISFQCSKRCQDEKIINGKYILSGDIFSEIELNNNCKINIDWLRKNINSRTKIALENNNYLNTSAYEIVTEPDFISKLVEKNEIYFLFDLAHARITAINKKINFQNYFSSLPMSKTIQLHICEYSIDKIGFAQDSHDEPNEKTYENIKKIVDTNKSIKYMTLEYYKDINKLINNLKKLNNLLKK